MSGLFDKAKEALNNEELTDKGLDAAANAVNKATGDKYADQVAKGREFGDSKLGDENAKKQA